MLFCNIHSSSTEGFLSKASRLRCVSREHADKALAVKPPLITQNLRSNHLKLKKNLTKVGENVKSLKKENDKLRGQVKSLSEDFQRFKDKMAAKVSKEVSPSSCESPSVQDVQFLSEGYDDLLSQKTK